MKKICAVQSVNFLPLNFVEFYLAICEQFAQIINGNNKTRIQSVLVVTLQNISPFFNSLSFLYRLNLEYTLAVTRYSSLRALLLPGVWKKGGVFKVSGFNSELFASAKAWKKGGFCKVSYNGVICSHISNFK